MNQQLVWEFDCSKVSNSSLNLLHWDNELTLAKRNYLQKEIRLNIDLDW